MNQDQENCGYMPCIEKNELNFAHGGNIDIIPNQQVVITQRKVKNPEDDSKFIFLSGIFLLGIELLQIKFLTTQAIEDYSNLSSLTITYIFLAFCLKTALSIISIMASGFTDRMDYFSYFSGLALTISVYCIVLSIVQLFLCWFWLKEYTGVDYVYMWYLVFMSLAELVAYLPVMYIFKKLS